MKEKCVREEGLIGIVLVTHGQMADGLLDAARMIIGPQQGLVGVSLQEGDDIEGLTERVRQAVEQVDSGGGALLLVDVFGASPFNASARVAMTQNNVEVLAGVNLPMVLEVVTSREGLSLHKAVALAKEAGITSVRTLSEALDKSSS